jgi:hypothetical protein
MGTALRDGESRFFCQSKAPLIMTVPPLGAPTSDGEMFRCARGLIRGNSTCYGRWFHMEYRGKRFTILQGVGPGSWKWMVQLHEHAVKSGESPTRAAAMNSVVWVIDKSLAPKKGKLVTPDN